MALAVAHSRGLDGMHAPSAVVRTRVAAAASRQHARQAKPNARLASAEVDALCAPDETGARLLRQAAERFTLSARAWHRVLKMARTIADLAGSEQIDATHIAEAIQYRRLAHA